MKRVLSILMCCCLAFTGCISGSFASEGTTQKQLFSDSFTYETAEAMMAGEVWGLEDVRRTDTLPPVLGNDVMSLHDKNSVRFNWTKVAGAGQYHPASTYTFSFDMKLKDKGDGSAWGGTGASRGLYVAFGGWYNLIELNDVNGHVKVCSSKVIPCNDALFLDKNVRAVVKWKGSTVSVDIIDADGKTLISGQRSGVMFTDMKSEKNAMTNLVLRCEDGAVEVDNFAFQVNKAEPMQFQNLSPGTNEQAVFQCDLVFDGKEPLAMTLDNAELLYLGNEKLKLGGFHVNGSYQPGTYHLKVCANSVQDMTSMELTLPDGGIVRRAYDALADGKTVYCYGSDKDAYKNITVHNEAVSVNDYQVTEKAPEYTGLQANVYNLVTSFDVPQSTRNFAWTAKTAFLQGAAMELQYRVAGETTWNTVAAVRENETVDTVDEDYFKCDLTGLKANTTYEYRIGKAGSADSADNWSQVYSFQTAPDNIGAFTFLAVGDTQGRNWNGTAPGDREYAYAEAAYREAFEAVPNPAFIMHAGDVVQTGDVQEQWNLHFKALGAYGAATPMFACMGNHDSWGSLFRFDYHFNHPNNGGSKALDSSITSTITDEHLKKVLDRPDETIYSYDYGNAHFVVLNSGSYGAGDQAFMEAQRQWLVQDLKANKSAKWKIVMFHEPVYHRLGGAESRPWLYDTIESYGVDLVLHGHSHLTTRTYPMKDGAIVTKSNQDDIEKGIGTVYTTIGSTNPHHDGHYDTGHMEEIMNLKVSTPSQSTYTMVTVSGQKLTYTTKQINGLVLDQFTITDTGRHPAVDETPDTDTAPDADKDGENIVPVPEAHKCSFKTYTTKATAKKNGKIVRKCHCGNVDSAVTIPRIKTVKLSKTSYAYNGKAKKPAVTVRNSKGRVIKPKYYSVTYKDNKEIGKATVTVKFRGQYKGKMTKTFRIKPAKPVISKPSSLKKSVTVKWKRGAKLQTTGYQVQIATNQKFTKNKRTVLVKGYKKNSQKFKSLKRKTTYYVKVRSYKTVKGVKYYSGWSKVRSVKTR